jgi:hypothetical protein
VVGERSGQQYPVSGDKPARFGKPAVIAYEAGQRYAIAIGEYHVVGRGGGDRAVADRTGAKAPVFVPDMTHRERRPCGELLHHRTRAAGGAVVGHQQLDVEVVLRAVGRQGTLERVRPVVGGDHDRDLHHRRRRSINFR